MNPLKLKHIYDKTIWGNDRLTEIRGEELKGMGTSWEISAHPYCQNEILNGEFKGKTLDELFHDNPKEILGNNTPEQMLRCAFLDAKDALSIQVHPDDDYARLNSNDQGKTESWYVLEAKPGARLVAGIKANDKETVKRAIENKKLEDMLIYHNVKAGDYIFIPAGMLHALGAGILAIEVGTNSNTTYRFYDYGRMDANGKERELHLKQSFDVVDFDLRTSVVHTPELPAKANQITKLHESKEFIVEAIDVAGSMKITTEGHFNDLVFVSGSGAVSAGNEKIKMNLTDSMFIPGSCKEYLIEGNCRVIRGWVR